MTYSILSIFLFIYIQYIVIPYPAGRRIFSLLCTFLSSHWPNNFSMSATSPSHKLPQTFPPRYPRFCLPSSPFHLIHILTFCGHPILIPRLSYHSYLHFHGHIVLYPLYLLEHSLHSSYSTSQFQKDIHLQSSHSLSVTLLLSPRIPNDTLKL